MERQEGEKRDEEKSRRESKTWRVSYFEKRKFYFFLSPFFFPFLFVDELFTATENDRRRRSATPSYLEEAFLFLRSLLSLSFMLFARQ